MNSDIILASRVSWQAVRDVFFQCSKVDIRPVVFPHEFPDEEDLARCEKCSEKADRQLASDDRKVGEMIIGKSKLVRFWAALKVRHRHNRFASM
jgi:hypothetical protein